MYHAQFLDRRMPDHRIFQRFHRQLQKLIRSTSSDMMLIDEELAARSPSLEKSILNVVYDKIQSSTRDVAHYGRRWLTFEQGGQRRESLLVLGVRRRWTEFGVKESEFLYFSPKHRAGFLFYSQEIVSRALCLALGLIVLRNETILMAVNAKPNIEKHYESNRGKHYT
ncbi:hypothetical protein TNCV_32641 [Trichonephila clavipes]|nr:hypothetical protein TNCV_32641 [Trichonephila clavipes]